jgi:HEPN domain-containing protein
MSGYESHRAGDQSLIYQEWLHLGDLDIQAAQILLAEDGPLPVIAFHLQQAIEKYLKGYLLSQNWSLRRIHDLEVLIRDAIDLDEEFTPFLESCQKITEYYIETRYPTGIHSVLVEGELQSDLTTAIEIATLIRTKLP